MSRFAASLVLLGALLSVAAWWSRNRGSHGIENTRKAGLPSAPTGTAEGDTGDWGVGLPTYWSPTLSQMLYLDASRFVTIENTEKVGGITSVVTYEYSTSFDIHAGASRGTEEFYFAGVTDGGDMDVDPEGRFLLLVGDDSVLYRLDLDGSSNLAPLYDPTTLWNLPRVRFIFRVQHATEGRVWILTYLSEVDAAGFGETVWEAVLFDRENDGLFESYVIDSEETFQLVGITDSSFWTDDFLYDN